MALKFIPETGGPAGRALRKREVFYAEFYV